MLGCGGGAWRPPKPVWSDIRPEAGTGICQAMTPPAAEVTDRGVYDGASVPAAQATKLGSSPTERTWRGWDRNVLGDGPPANVVIDHVVHQHEERWIVMQDIGPQR